MKKNILLLISTILILTLVSSCKGDGGGSSDEDLSTEILGKWQETFPNDFGCGIVFETSNTFSNSNLTECGSSCAGTPVSGTYTLTGNYLSVSTGLGGIESEISIENDVLTILFDLDDSSDDMRYMKLDC